MMERFNGLLLNNVQRPRVETRLYLVKASLVLRTLEFDLQSPDINDTWYI